MASSQDSHLDLISRSVRAEPRLPLVGPYMAYLLGMMIVDFFAGGAREVAVAGHIILSAWIIWLFRRHYPSMGHWFPVAGILVGIFAAWMWVAGQHGLERIELDGSSLGGRLSIDRTFPFLKLLPQEIVDVRAQFETAEAFWAHVFLKITRAVTVVPIVEELFWRGFILRAFIDWNRSEQVSLGRFTMFSFLGSSLLSVVQHPANWGVSILCWMLYNGLFYWKRSLKCNIVAHAVTNLVLYIYVVRSGDWQFW